MAYPVIGVSVAVLAIIAIATVFWPPAAWALLLVVPVVLMGVGDLLQTRHAVLRNFPLLGKARYLLEMIRPEINQYFIESEQDGRPLNREQRSIVYQRSKRALQTLPFGTQLDVGAVGYEWINHSILARHAAEPPRITIGEGRCQRPYAASLLNISAMSYGSLSGAAVRALNGGAALGGFAHNTGEGGISDHHRQGGDVIWQIGTGYFGCRTPDGRFDPDRFEDQASAESIRMIEVKLSQGAKPGHGGILPAAKITPEIAAIRGVEMGRDVLSPPGHTAFDSPRGLLEFLAGLRERSGGKPVGFKLCVGDPVEFIAICRAMLETGLRPDFITVDGGEGGTGAAPLEFSNRVGTPLADGLTFVHNALTGFGLRGDVRVIASGKIITGFDLVRAFALGADLGNAARGFMLSLGCIQARRCNSNHCPVGVATTNPRLERGLVVSDKRVRVANYHAETITACMELLGAAGRTHPAEVTPAMIHRRISAESVRTLADLIEWLEPGELADGRTHRPAWRRWLEEARADRFNAAVA
ncbi:MAG: FMN-binding glutamate synthase family protein [Planctomycetota bacterium]|jgi:glutamate synthase domain-containing protein 2